MTGVLATLAALRAGTVTPTEIARTCLAATAAYDDPAIWISRVADAALLARAAALEQDPQARTLPLYGIPFAVKDNIDVAGLDTTAGCPAYAYRPAQHSTVVERLCAAGAMVVGKTNLDQFATGLVGTRSPYGAPHSVFSAAHVSGGSSSGSAVAVAAGLVAFALGTDTAGSGRVPAAFNNVVGLKPTRGLIPATGTVPACQSLDCISIFAESSADALAVLAVAQGFDPADPYAREPQSVGLPDHAAIRVGVLSATERTLLGPEQDALYQSAIDRLAADGAVPVTLDMSPFLQVAALLYDGPFVAERLAAIQPFFTAHAEQIDAVVRGIIGGAVRYSAADAYRGEYARRMLTRMTDAALRAVDIVLVPTTPLHPTIAAVANDPVGLNAQLGRWTNFVNLLDLAAVAVPAGFCSAGLPFGVTVIGPAFSDAGLAALADRLHRALGAGSGLARDETLPEVRLEALGIPLAVAGAHLSGMPLNHQLVALGATLECATRTASDYRLYALPDTVPPKPGLVRSPGHVGAGIEIEIWRLSDHAFGRFVAGLPPPMGIGTVMLADGRAVPGFLCEPCALAGATDITAFGGWRAYMQFGTR